MSNVRLPSAADRHLLNRCTFGVTPALVAGAKAAGGGPAWLNRQLHPESIRDSAATRMATWFPVLSKSPQVQWQDARDGRATVYDMGVDFGNWTMLRRTYSRRQLHEVMVSFWSDLLHIPVSETKSWPLRISYDRSIRKHALGRFDNLLVATETHPAMGAYLDNATSTRTKLNENLGREVLELHTVGVGGGYSESDVLDSARILTGYRVDLGTTWRGRYSTVDHHVGAVKVIGFTSANASADGRKVAEAYLRYLAHHPLTAQRVAARLCTRFGSDEPSAGYVNRVAKVYSQSGTDIKATLKAVLSDRAFQSSIGAKVRTPAEDIVATILLSCSATTCTSTCGPRR